MRQLMYNLIQQCISIEQEMSTLCSLRSDMHAEMVDTMLRNRVNAVESYSSSRCKQLSSYLLKFRSEVTKVCTFAEDGFSSRNIHSSQIRSFITSSWFQVYFSDITSCIISVLSSSHRIRYVCFYIPYQLLLIMFNFSSNLLR